MGGSVFHRIAALLVGGTLAVSANLPPEHGHPSAPGQAAIVHRHASLHVFRCMNHDGLSDSVGLIIWIDSSYLSGAPAPLGHLDLVAVDTAVVEPPVIVRRIVFEAHASGIHGPPRPASGSRAPPFLTSL